MIKLRQSSMNAAIAKLKKVGSAARYGAHEGIGQQGKKLLDTVKQNMSLTDHSQADLTKMDHPYAKRHKEIRIHKGTAPTLTDTTRYIHKQDGDLVRAIRGEKQSDKIVYRVYVQESAAVNRSGQPYAPFVLKTEGTKKMFGRPVIPETANTPQVKSGMRDGVLSTIAKALAKV